MDYLFFGFLLWLCLILGTSYARKIGKVEQSTAEYVGFCILVGFACFFWPITLPAGLVIGSIVFLVKLSKR